MFCGGFYLFGKWFEWNFRKTDNNIKYICTFKTNVVDKGERAIYYFYICVCVQQTVFNILKFQSVIFQLKRKLIEMKSLVTSEQGLKIDLKINQHF